MTTQIQTTQTSLVVCLGNKKIAACQNFQQASDLISNYISYYGLGSSAFYKNKNAGLVYHPTKGAFAFVSYNGKVWKGSNLHSLKNEQITNLLLSDF